MLTRHTTLISILLSLLLAACGKSSRDAGGASAARGPDAPSTNSVSSPQRASETEPSLHAAGKDRPAFTDVDDGREEGDVMRQAAEGRRPSPDGRIFRGSCSDCFGKVGAAVVEACSKEQQCGACLAGANCSAVTADVASRWRAACVTLATRCNGACFLSGAPTPTCPPLKLRSE
jgi:hypothetical protein